MSDDLLKYLLRQYATGASTPEEVRELFEWIRETEDDALLKAKIKELWSKYEDDNQLPDVDWDAIYRRITNTSPAKKVYLWPRVAAAVAVITVLGVGGYFMVTRQAAKPIVNANAQPLTKDDVAPGGDRAVLTLADGTQIVLDSAANGSLTQQGGIKIIKLENGQLAYDPLNQSSPLQGTGEVLYNTISTPRGGQYRIELADGSRVWLNSASSLRFPAAFTGNERNVELTGEGYFEVVHNTSKPFKVSANGVSVRVFGTHFNISAYTDDAVIKTTLLEGSVEVEKNGLGRMIKPGEQAQMSGQSEPMNNSEIYVQSVNVEDVVAWKEGRFIFHDDNIQSVMKQLARWYDVTVSYEGDITNEEFVGVINRSRYENIMEILDMLEKTRTVSFIVNGRHVIVKPFVEQQSGK